MTELFSNPDDPQTIPTEPVPTAPTAPAPVVNPEPVDPNSLFADQLSSIVTDDGRQKYTDVPTALASIPHAQGHIQTLTAEVQQLKEELDKRRGAEELMNVLNQNQSTQQVTDQPSVTGLDETNVIEILDSHLEQKAQRERAQANSNTVKAELSEKFGDKAATVFATKAAQLNLSTQALTSLAETSPAAALALFKDVPVTDPQPTTPGSLQSPTSTPTESVDYMSKFSGKQTGLQSKWQEAKAAANTTLNGDNR